MARKHWVRDARIAETGYTYNGNCSCSTAILYNFLRNAGWDLLWECDSEKGNVLDPNHVPDGDVQTAGTASWSKINGAETLSKDDVFFHSGVRSLKAVVGASGHGVVSSALLSMTNPTSFRTATGDTLTGPVGDEMILYDNTARFPDPGIVGSYIDQSQVYPTGGYIGNFLITRWVDAYTIKFRNPSGTPKSYITRVEPSPPGNPGLQDDFVVQPRYEMRLFVATTIALDVEVDRGNGSYYNVGTIPANGGVFTEYSNFWFKRTGSGNTTFRLVAQGAGTFYLGGAHIFRSHWERPSLLQEGSDGIITAPDQFSTAGSYTFTSTDVGKRIFIYDDDPGAGRNKNSGSFEITGYLGGGVVQLDLRSGSASLTSATGIKWRMALVDTLTYPNSTTPMQPFMYSGFGLQSPHASKWRFFLRQFNVSGQTGKGTFQWASPVDCDFNVSTGHFYKSDPSVMRNRAMDWTLKEQMHFSNMPYITGGDTITRIFTMLSEDGAFFFHTNMGNVSGQENSVFLVGYLGSDLPGIRSFYEMCRFAINAGVTMANEMTFANTTKCFSYAGTGFNRAGLTEEVCVPQLGYGQSTASDTDVETQSNAGQNPWSGREWVRPLILCSREGGQPPSIQMSDCGVFQTRANMSYLVTFDSNNYLHFQNGLVIEWMGETLV